MLIRNGLLLALLTLGVTGQLFAASMPGVLLDARCQSLASAGSVERHARGGSIPAASGVHEGTPEIFLHLESELELHMPAGRASHSNDWLVVPACAVVGRL